MSDPKVYPGATVCDGVTFGAGCVVGCPSSEMQMEVV